MPHSGILGSVVLSENQLTDSPNHEILGFLLALFLGFAGKGVLEI